jgi:hypothetical protein
VAALLAVVPDACAAHIFRAPAGAGEPAPGGDEVWTQVAGACRALRGYQAELAIAGRVANRRIPGFAGATVNAAVMSDGRIGIEAIVSGQPAFRLGGTASEATLLLTTDRRVVRAPAAEILEALVGVRLDPARLLDVFTGCLLGGPVERAVKFPDLLAVTAGDTTAYLAPAGSVWRLRGATFPGGTVDYQEVAGDLPRRFTIRSEHRQPPASLTIRVRDAAINPVVSDAAFVVHVPDGAQPMTMDELREAAR